MYRSIFRVFVFLIFVLVISGQNSRRIKNYQPLTPENWSLLDIGDAKAGPLKFTGKIDVKIASRKNEFKVGEIMIVDFAILNSSSEPLFILEPSSNTIILRGYDHKGEEVKIASFEISQLGLSPRLFNLVGVGELETGSLQLLIGCEEATRSIQRKVQVLHETSLGGISRRGRRLFEEDLFVSHGDGCLDTSEAGNYQISAQIENKKKVVLSPSQAKTYIGVIESNSFGFKVNSDKS